MTKAAGRVTIPSSGSPAGADPVGATWGNSGRNQFRGPSNWNLDASLFRTIPLGRYRFELRVESSNVLNHPQFTQIPERSVVGSFGPQAGLPSHFLNRDFTDSGIRSMWVQVKFIF